MLVASVFVVGIISGIYIVTKTRYICKVCQKKKARKACILNSFLIYGIPCAIGTLCRAREKQQLPNCYEGLNKANKRALSINKENSRNEAVSLYEEILRKNNGFNAGVRYNMGMAYLLRAEWMQATQAFEDALKDCSNYEEAATALLMCYKEIGGTCATKEAKLREKFGFDL